MQSTLSQEIICMEDHVFYDRSGLRMETHGDVEMSVAD